MPKVDPKPAENEVVAVQPRSNRSNDFTFLEVKRMAESVGVAPIGSKEEILARVDKAREIKQSQRVEEVKNGVGRVGDILIQHPLAMSVELVKDDTGKSFYRFQDNSRDAGEARDKIREILTELWQSGAYNYDMIARQLRVSSLDVQAMIDVSFSDKHRLI